MIGDGSLIVTGVSWAGGRPQLRCRSASEQETNLVDLEGLTLNYRAALDSPRHCLGHKPFRRSEVAWFDCDRTPLHEGRKCDRCAAVDATFASQLHHAHNRDHGELDPAVVRHLQQPNHLYLAAFRDGSIKVGTSTMARLGQRLSEQGAWLARVVADASDGFAVRSLEDRCTVELGIPQSVSIRRKIEGLLQPRPAAALAAELSMWSLRVHELIEESRDDRVAAISTDWSFDNADDSTWSGLHPYPLKLDSGAHHIELTGASGRAAVLTRPGTDDRFVADLHAILGVELELGEFDPDPLAVQDSLF